MNVLELLSRATLSPEPVYTGEWATLGFRPDLGSQQEFIVGVAAAIRDDEEPYIKWLPSFQKLSSLYGELIPGSAARELIQGSEKAIRTSFKNRLSAVDTGTPHVRIIPCGRIATDNVEAELTSLLKRHVGAFWADPKSRESPTDDDWAYSLMRQSIEAIKANIFIPNRTLSLGGKTFNVALDNGKSYGNIVSACYASFPTIEKHVTNALLQVLAAHKISKRPEPGALFVVLPTPDTSVEQMLMRRTQDFLGQIEDAGVSSFANPEVAFLASDLERWASATPPHKALAENYTT